MTLGRIGKRKAVFVLAALVITAMLLLLLRPGRGVRLKVIKSAIEQGQSVVFFRVESDRRFQLTMVERVIGERRDNPFQFTNYGAAEFWAPAQQWPLGGNQVARAGFGVQAPTNRTWRLRAEVMLDSGRFVDRLRQMPEVYRMERSLGRPFLQRCWNTLGVWGNTRLEWIESEMITNSMALGSSGDRPVVNEPVGCGTGRASAQGRGYDGE